jgi:hypothetical protein
MDKTTGCNGCLLRAKCAICGILLCQPTGESEQICRANGRWPPTREKQCRPFCKYCYARFFDLK